MVDMYGGAEWRAIAQPPPLVSLADEDLGLLHRQWMWANQQKERFYELLGQRDHGIDRLAGRTRGSMVVWYALVWSVIEAMHDRKIDLRDPLGADVREVEDLLRKFRNAVVHVPESGEYYDQRMVDLIAHPEGVPLIRTVHQALGRMLLEELRRRTAAGARPGAGVGRGDGLGAARTR
jgi:hypothetical protein